MTASVSPTPSPGRHRSRREHDDERTTLFDPAQMGLAWALAMGPLRIPM